MVQSVNLSEAEEKCDAMLRSAAADAVAYQIGLLQKQGRPAVIAMDGTKMSRHDGDPDMKHLINSKCGSGTAVFEERETVKAVFMEAALHAASCSMAKGGKRADSVRKMLQECIDLGILPEIGGKRGTVLLDRGYYSVDVMFVINDAEFAFVMPAVKNGTIKDAIKEHANEKRPAVSWHTMKSAESKEFAFRLIINKNPRKLNSDNAADRCYVFAAAVKCKSCDELPEYAPASTE